MCSLFSIYFQGYFGAPRRDIWEFCLKRRKYRLTLPDDSNELYSGCSISSLTQQQTVLTHIHIQERCYGANILLSYTLRCLKYSIFPYFHLQTDNSKTPRHSMFRGCCISVINRITSSIAYVTERLSDISNLQDLLTKRSMAEQNVRKNTHDKAICSMDSLVNLLTITRNNCLDDSSKEIPKHCLRNIFFKQIYLNTPTRSMFGDAVRKNTFTRRIANNCDYAIPRAITLYSKCRFKKNMRLVPSYKLHNHVPLQLRLNKDGDRNSFENV